VASQEQFLAALGETAEAVAGVMDYLLPAPAGPEAKLAESMRYAVLGGGKRLRSFFAVESARLFGVARGCSLRVAAAIEFLHGYSLVHDDLPSMDDSDLRRGRPSLHKAFDEATAILAGDALLTLAFEVLAETDTHADPVVRVELVRRLAQAAGARGMVGGQVLDLLAEKEPLDIPAITRLQRLKTGEIFAFSCESGGILGKAAPQVRHALIAYAHSLGLAFQIADDLLDIAGSATETGKPTGRDAVAGKATFVSVLGPERARAQAWRLADQAIEHLDLFEDKADLLRAAARFVFDRRA
jgi:farnesyl diphosphate synthase